jgi:RNA polymerase sigma factor (TIGR02999 family)
MAEKTPQNITLLLNEISNGNEVAIEKVLPLVYNELRRISSKYLRNEYKKHTFQTTELVHEAYIKLIGNQQISWQSRAHFFGIASKTMRQILVDYARKRNSQKRGSGKTKLSLDDAQLVASESNDQILALDEALKKLEFIEERSGKIVELRYFSGLTIEETAEILNISSASVKRDWQFAKAWLYKEIQQN